MKRCASIVGVVILLIAIFPWMIGASQGVPEQSKSEPADTHKFPQIWYWSNEHGFVIGITAMGQLVTLEMPAGYEHINAGHILEGYSLCFFDKFPAFDVYQYSSDNFISLDFWSNQSGSTTYPGPVITENLIVSSLVATQDLKFYILQTIVWLPWKSGIMIHMTVGNHSLITGDLVLKRHADLDTDTGGTSGWAGFNNIFNEGDDYVVAYTTNPPESLKAHTVLMAGDADSANVDYWDDFSSCPSETVLDPTILPAYGDYMGTLEWDIGSLAPGETFDCGMYYAVLGID